MATISAGLAQSLAAPFFDQKIAVPFLELEKRSMGAFPVPNVTPGRGVGPVLSVPGQQPGSISTGFKSKLELELLGVVSVAGVQTQPGRAMHAEHDEATQSGSGVNARAPTAARSKDAIMLSMPCARSSAVALANPEPRRRDGWAKDSGDNGVLFAETP
eukprot:Amastigsp_a342767_21.p2 type:complete len:159 gc:universal Amastigsp_a342767_21:551-75(-)